LALLAAACYFPVRFDAEIEITRAGFYDMVFDGYLADVELFDDLKRNRIKPDGERARVATIDVDLARDGAVKERRYMGKGLFRVKWQRKGDLLGHKMVTFIRRNETMLSLKYVRDTGLITMEGTIIAEDRANQLAAIGLGMQGQLRVRTDARVVEQNAKRVDRSGAMPVYVWEIEGLAGPVPKLVVQVR
jgi:hypothetical protein